MATITKSSKAIKTNKAEKKDIYDRINEVVIAGLEKEGLKWFMGWKDSSGPINWATERPYTGFNIFWLNALMRGMDYSANEWMTYNQAKANGGQVMKGEKSTEVFFWKISWYDKEDKKYYNSLEDIAKAGIQFSHKRFKKCFTLRHFNVFNIDQIEGLEPKGLDKKEETADQTPNEMAEALINGYIGNNSIREIKPTFSLGGPSLAHGTGGAYYMPSMDRINMPIREDFCDLDTYYKTLFHEMAHSTGHKNRLDRETLMDIKVWGDETYAKEELVAEIAAMYLAGQCGLNPADGEENSQAYIKGWTKRLKEDKKECVTAMSQAVKAVELIEG
jgi:antirestriction protein ArdC